MEIYNSLSENIYKVYTSQFNGNITFFYKKGENKVFEISYKPKKQYKGKPYIFGEQMLKHSGDTLIITQGEESCIAIKAMGIEHDTVGSPKLSSFDWMANSIKLINNYKKIIVIGKKKWVIECYKRLNKSHEVLTIDNSVLNGATSVYNSYTSKSIGDLEKAIEEPISIKIDGIITVDECKFLNLGDIERIYTGFNDIDTKACGLIMGSTSLWTGKTGEGKSTVMNKLMLSAMKQEYRVCLYSGEFNQDQAYSNICIQAVGYKNIKFVPILNWKGEDSGEYEIVVNRMAENKFRGFVRDKLYIKSNDYKTDSEVNNIINIFEEAFELYNCRLFIIDNMMSIMANSVKDDINQSQTYLMNRLIDFAVRCNVHVAIVAHPRKSENNTLKNDDVAGSSNIPNMAGSVFSVKRLNEDELKKVKENNEKDSSNILFTGMISCTKNRARGKLFHIKTNYDDKSRQIYGKGDEIVTYDFLKDNINENYEQKWLDDMPF